MKNTSKKTKKSKNKLMIVLGIIIVIIGVMTVLELTNTTHFFHKQKAVSSTITKATSPSVAQTNTQTGTSSSTAQSSNTTPSTSAGTKVSAPSTTGATLVAPYGTFISNHHPGQNGSNTQEQSTCTTTPGASCYIQFTNNGVVKTLAASTADGTGSVYWNWDVNTAGFTTGSWQIEAIATLNGQTSTTKDQIPLVVQ